MTVKSRNLGTSRLLFSFSTRDSHRETQIVKSWFAKSVALVLIGGSAEPEISPRPKISGTARVHILDADHPRVRVKSDPLDPSWSGFLWIRRVGRVAEEGDSDKNKNHDGDENKRNSIKRVVHLTSIKGWHFGLHLDFPKNHRLATTRKYDQRLTYRRRKTPTRLGKCRKRVVAVRKTVRLDL